MKKSSCIFFLFISASFLFSLPFNKNITEEDLSTLDSGSVLIKNINYQKRMCLDADYSEETKLLTEDIKELSPKYLAEVIQIRDYEGNEDLPQKLNELLNNVSDYAGIPYYSERAEEWYDLYSSAVITSSNTIDKTKYIYADLEMEPFGTVNEFMQITNTSESVLYTSKNLNKLSYYNSFDCVWPEKMHMNILLIREGDKWILYGIGGVNAPRIPFFTERIETSFINRIKTFCNFIFTQI